MSEQKWKPGDLASAYIGSRGRRHIVAYRNHAQYPWVALDADDGYAPMGRTNVTDARPLVAIDPEDREQVERLARGWHNEREFAIPWDELRSRDRDESFRTLQAALREFASPGVVKPDEPLGLGAVVEDAEGGRWIKIDIHRDCNDWVDLGAHSHKPDDENETVRHFYRNITAVKVLSAGVVA